MSDLVPGINTHMPMLLETFKDVVMILLYFNVGFKVEPLMFTRLMRGGEEPFGLTRHAIHIIWSQEMAPQVTVGLTSIYCTLGLLDISLAVKVYHDYRDHPPDFHHVCLEGYGPHTTFKNWCAYNHLIFG